MRQNLLAVFIIAMFGLWAETPAQAGAFSSSQLCWAAPPTISDNPDINPDAFADCIFDNPGVLHMVTPGASGDQIFDGSVSGVATADTWKVSASVSVQNYMRDMYQYSSTTMYPEIYPTTAEADAGFSDSLTVTSAGGPGVYSLSYIFSLDGSLTASDPSIFFSAFCAEVSLPEGTGTQTSTCVSYGNTAPLTFTLTYADLQFGGPINPTINIFSYATIQPIDPDQAGTDADTLLTGSAAADFGSTVHLQSLLVTDANGNPIPDISVSAASGFNYTLDPANQASSTPEPAGLSVVGLAMLAGAGLVRRFRRA